MNIEQEIKGLREGLIECEDARCLYDLGDGVIDRLESTLSELKTQRARADRLHDLFLRVSEAAGLELFESPTVVLGEVKILRARTDEARSIINDLAFCIDPNAIGDAATELFARAEKFLTEPTPPEATP